MERTGIGRRPWRRLDSRWDDVARWRIHTRVRTVAGDDAPWVVLVHGLGVSSRYLAPLALALGERFRVAVPDLPGHGRTPRRGAALGLAEQVDVLRAWSDAVGIERPYLVGNSYGCQLVLELAGQPGMRSRGLLLVGPTMDPAAPTAAGQLLRLLRDAPLEPLSLVALVVAEHLHRPSQAIRELRSGLDHDIESAARRVQSSTTVVRGARDRVAPRPWVERLAGWLPHGRAIELPSGAHAVHVSHPEQVAALVDA